MHRSKRVVASRGRESAGAIWRRREAGRFSGLDRGGSGAVFHYYFRATGTRWEGKTRKIRPSGGDLCSFRQVAGRSVQDCGKVVQKLAQREDENHKLCTTLCAPLRLGTRIVQVSFPLGVWCVGVVVRRCAIRSFSLPPAETGFPFRRRGRGGRQVAAGRAHGRGRGWPCALPPLRTVIRHTSDIVRHTSGIVRHTSGIVRHASGIVRHCTRVRPPLSSALPHPAHGGAGRGATTARTLFRSGADTPRERPTGERYIIYTRAQARGRERFAQGGGQRCG